MPNDVASLFDSHRARVYRWALAMCRSHADALDAVQEVFVRMLRTRPALTNERAAISWLRRATSSVVVDRWRNRAAGDRCIRVLRLADARTSGAVDSLSISPAEAQETADAIRTAIAQLSEQQRLVVLAKVFDELTFEQVAAELEIAVPTAKTHYLRALARLRDRLASDAADAFGMVCRKQGERNELRDSASAIG